MIRRALLAVVLLAFVACGGSSSPSAPSRPAFTRSGTGNAAFDMPTDVARIRVTGTYTGHSSNFIIWVNNQLIVNELLGTGWPSTSYSGTHQLPAGGGVTRVENSTGVAWTITEVR
jgi:hypothetical protein